MPTIAYLGPEHTNAHLAAQKKFGSKSRYVHQPTVDDVFTWVERDRADFGVVPIENSLEGAVTHTLDRFIDFKDSPVQITGEIEFHIQHYLITKPGLGVFGIKTVYSHPQALAQCRRWIETRLSKSCGLIETSSTSEAVLRVAESAAKAIAAIGSQEAARSHGLSALPIRDERDNKTRFLVLGKKQPARFTRSKTSILMALKDKPGALYDALMPFKREAINLTKIESRPSKRRAWEYFFFVDIAGHASDGKVKRALSALKKSTSLLKVLGSYPAAAK